MIIDANGAICVYRGDFFLIMAELSQRQQDRISKSSTVSLRSQLVRGGMEEEEVAQMARVDLKAAANQVEAEKQGDAKSQPLSDDSEEILESPEVTAPKSHEYRVLKSTLQLRKLEIGADKEARKAEAKQGARKAEAEVCKLEADAEARKAEAEQAAEARKIEADFRKAV